MNRRSFLGTVAAVAAAAVGALMKAKPQGPPIPYVSRGMTVDRLPDDIAHGDIIVWRATPFPAPSKVQMRVTYPRKGWAARLTEEMLRG